jgi:outer membrane protein assembly factor BamB
MRCEWFVPAILIVSACSNSAGTHGPSRAPGPETAIVTNLYDNARSGSTSAEKVLNTANVSRGTFGRLFSRTVDGLMYGHVLYVPGLSIKGGKRNVIFAATEANIVYAFDADDPAAAEPLWSRKLAAPMTLPMALTLPDGTMIPAYPSCQDLKAAAQVGITSTPTIDLAANTIYVVSKTVDAQRLHALDLATGNDQPGSPAVITATGFIPALHLNRPGLLLQDGVVYIAFGSHCDDQKTLYHGWIFAYDAKTLKQRGVYNTTPTGQAGAIWQSGVGLTGDGKGGVLAATGNGLTTKAPPPAEGATTPPPPTDDDGTNMVFSVIRVKLTGDALALADHYFPPNTAALGMRDLDLATGVNVLPGLIMAGGKEGMIYLLDDNLKQKGAPVKVDTNPDSKRNSVLHMLTVWNGPSGPVVFTWPTGGGLTSFAVADGQLKPPVTNAVRTPAHPGGSVTVSSDGTKAGTGVVWATVPDLGDSWHETADGKLFAFDAADINKVLWSSDLDSADTVGKYAKFSPPVVANGRVYVVTFDQKIVAYGLKK